MRLLLARGGLVRVILLLGCSAVLFSSFGCVGPFGLLQSGGVAGQLRLIHAGAGEQDLGAAVVYLDDGPRRWSGWPLRSAKLVFGEGGSIDPPLLAVSVGQRIQLKMQGGLLHQPFTYSLSADQGAPPNGSGELWSEDNDSRELTVERAGVVRIYCSLHRNERAVIFVSPSPYFSVVDSRGKYEIEDVPAGAYRLVLWSEVVEGTVRSVTVESGSWVASNVWIDARKIPR